MHRERIILADDHPIFRDGLRRLLQRTLPEAEITEADSYQAMLRTARRSLTPTAFIIDLMFGERSVEPELILLRQEFDRASIIVLSATDELGVAERLLRNGVDGFISKAVISEQVVSGICSVLEGEQILLVCTEPGLSMAEKLPKKMLTPRQHDVLRLLAQGKTNKEIAQILEISPYTVRVHVSALMNVLDAKSRTAAATKAADYGWV